MRIHWLSVAPLVAGAGLWLAGRSAPTAQSLPRVAAPIVIVLEGDPEGTSTEVMLRSPGLPQATRSLGRVPHVSGSSRKAVVATWRGAPVVLVVAAERERVHASGYNSALYRVSGGTTTRLVGDVADGTAPMVTARGTTLIQRGHDGPDVQPDPATRSFRERTDPLTIAAVDLDTGSTRTVWSGAGQYAFLGAPMRGDEVCVYHSSDAGAELLALDAAGGTVRALTGLFPPLARDFTYDPVRNEVVYVRPERPGSRSYEIVALVADGSRTTRTLIRAESDHLMPHRLVDGAVGFSSAGDRGLAIVPRGVGSQPVPSARLGDGADAVLDQTPDGRWLAVRHTTRTSESLALMDLTSGTTVVLSSPQRLTEFVGFATAAVSP